MLSTTHRALAVCIASLVAACGSSDTGDTDDTTGSGGGSSTASTTTASATASTSTTGGAEACPAGAESGAACALPAGSTCTTPVGCCACLDLAPCGLTWACAKPDGNSSACPAAAPAAGDACSSFDAACGYCDASGPKLLVCASSPPAGVWQDVSSAQCQ